MRSAVVVGAGLAGSAAALALAELDFEVTVVEPDPLDGDRPGIPQAKHSHLVLGLAREILAERFPAVFQALIRKGAYEIPLSWGGEAETSGVALLACSRGLIDQAFAQAVTDHARIDVVPSGRGRTLQGGGRTAAELIYDIDDGRRAAQAADWFVVATGARGRVEPWLSGNGKMRTETSPIDLVYYTRFFEAHSAQPMPRPFAAGLGPLGYGLYPAEGRRYSILIALNPNERELHAVGDGAVFDRMAQGLPGLAPWVEGGTALGPPARRHIVSSRRRHLSGAPGYDNVYLIADSLIAMNPIYGTGMSLGLRDATAAADRIADGHPAREFYVAHDASTGSRYMACRYADRLLRRARKRMANGMTPNSDAQTQLMRAIRHDRPIWERFVRSANLLDPPEVLLEPGFVNRVEEVCERSGDASPGDLRTTSNELREAAGLPRADQDTVFHGYRLLDFAGPGGDGEQ